MSMVINSNIMSLNAQNQLSKSQSSMQSAMERLTSGMRINSAKDDAAGLAISNRMTSQIRGLDQAVRNANDGISLIQTAEGALQESTNILQRMRELSIQSANGTYDSGNRSTLNAEVSQLKSELTRIAETTSFNGQKILDGTLGAVSLQVGSDANQTIGLNIGRLDAQSLGVSSTAGIGSISRAGAGADEDAAALDLSSLGTGDLIINGVAIDAANSSADNASSAGKTASAISTAAAINEKTSLSGVSAIVGSTTVGGTAMTANANTGTIDLNGVEIDIVTTADAATTRASVVQAINAESARTGVVATDTGKDVGGVTLTAADGRNIVLSLTDVTADETGLGFSASDGEFEITTGTVTLVSNSGEPIVISSGATGQASDAGFQEGTYAGVAAQVSSSLDDNQVAMDAGDVVINGVSIGASLASSDTASFDLKEASAIAKAAAINEVSDRTGVTAVVNQNILSNEEDQTSDGGATIAGSINGVEWNEFTSTTDASTNRQSFVNAINAISGQTGVRAVDTGELGTESGGGVQFIADDGRNITINFADENVASEVGARGNATGGTAETFTGEFTLQSDQQIKIELGAATGADISNSGLKVGTYGGGESGSAIANIDISTAEGAQKAISAIDNALTKINEVRGDLGAVNNRLEFTINNLSSISQNVSAARSRIEDADFAVESANLSRSQVLQQAGTAMLAQANAQPQQVLSLLQ